MGMRHVEILSDRYSNVQTATFSPYYDYYVDMAAVTDAVRRIAGRNAVGA